MTYTTAGLISYLLIHRLGSPKCVVRGISGCSGMFVIKRIATRKIRFERIGLELISIVLYYIFIVC